MKSKGGGWTEGGFTFTAEQEQEIRRAFGFSHNRFPDHGKAAVIRSVAGAMTKVASDKTVLATDPRMARDRVEKVAELLAEAAAKISKMTEAERDVFDLATSGDPVTLGDLSAALQWAATGFRKAADGHALQRGEKVAGLDAVALFVAAQAAAAWREAFGIEPVEHDGSDFVTVLDVVLTVAGLPLLGRDAIRTAIKGPRKNRK